MESARLATPRLDDIEGTIVTQTTADRYRTGCFWPVGKLSQALYPQKQGSNPVWAAGRGDWPPAQGAWRTRIGPVYGPHVVLLESRIMLEKSPGPGDQYHDWEYPDPQDIEDLVDPLFDRPSPSEGPGISVLLKIVVGLMALGLVGSLLLPVLAPLMDSGTQGETSSRNPTEASQVYQQWIESSVNSALGGYGGASQVQFLGVQFDDSILNPIIVIQSERVDLLGSPGMDALHGYSIAVLQSLFADERAQRATLMWVEPAAYSGSGETSPDVILIVGMLRQTAQGIEWTSIGPSDLRYVADYYQEPPPTNVEST
jgi:hypothetical protein